MNNNNPPAAAGSFRKKVLYLIAAFTAVLVLKIFFFDAYRIPTSSMADTIISGDHILVNKAAYAINIPSYIPFTDITFTPVTIFRYAHPERNDIVVFQFTGNELLPPAGVYFVKRVIGLPGDTLIIKNKNVSVNGRPVKMPEHAKFDSRNFNTQTDPLLYFNGNGWSADNMGPLVVPYKGMTIQLDHQNIYKWGMIINREFGKRVVSVEGSVISINGKPSRSYTFKNNYYFLLGDNRDNSIDSRYRGFVSEKYITGRAELIYYSYGSSIRWDRMFSIIK